MPRFLVLTLLVLLARPAVADDVVTVKVADCAIQLPLPPGMSEVPGDNPMTKAAADLTPPDLILLRNCVTSEVLDPTKAPDPATDIMTSRTFASKEVLMNIDSGTFIDFVWRQALEVTHGVLKRQDSSFDFVETQKRLDDFQKDTGVGMKDASDIYSLGIVSRNDDCLSFMTARYLTVTEDGKTTRQKCIDVYGYLLLRQKVVVVLTSLIKPTILHDDIRTLKHEAEKYQLALQTLNNL